MHVGSGFRILQMFSSLFLQNHAARPGRKHIFEKRLQAIPIQKCRFWRTWDAVPPFFPLPLGLHFAANILLPSVPQPFFTFAPVLHSWFALHFCHCDLISYFRCFLTRFFLDFSIFHEIVLPASAGSTFSKDEFSKHRVQAKISISKMHLKPSFCEEHFRFVLSKK